MNTLQLFKEKKNTTFSLKNHSLYVISDKSIIFAKVFLITITIVGQTNMVALMKNIIDNPQSAGNCRLSNFISCRI